MKWRRSQKVNKQGSNASIQTIISRKIHLFQTIFRFVYSWLENGIRRTSVEDRHRIYRRVRWINILHTHWIYVSNSNELISFDRSFHRIPLMENLVFELNRAVFLVSGVEVLTSEPVPAQAGLAIIQAFDIELKTSTRVLRKYFLKYGGCPCESCKDVSKNAPMTARY